MKPPPLVPKRTVYAVILAVYTAIGLLLTAYRYLEDAAWKRYDTFWQRFIDEMTGAYTALTAIPIAIFVAGRFPISKATWKTAVPMALLGAIVYSAIHTTLMWATRSVLYPADGLGPYDYGNMVFRYPMEASNDVISYAFISAFVYAWRGLAAARQTELEAAQLQTELAQAQLENLRLQLNPHFLFNTLNAISAVMYEDVGKADRMIAQLSDFLRVVLESRGVHQVSLAQELGVEQKYVEIMQTRLEQNLELAVTIEDAARDALVPFMILQPLLENSIRHGIPPGRGALDITIGAVRANGSTVIRVADDGVGYAPSAEDGHGLTIVRSRLKHMYGDDASFTIAPRSQGGTEAVLTLPYRESAEARA